MKQLRMMGANEQSHAPLQFLASAQKRFSSRNIPIRSSVIRFNAMKAGGGSRPRVANEVRRRAIGRWQPGS